MTNITVPILDEATIEEIVERTINKVLSLKEENKKDTTLLTTQQVSDEFVVSRVTIINYGKAGKLLPYGKAGKQHTFRRCDCQEAFRHKLPSIKDITQ